MRLRVVAYAINGRGMGHLVRQLAILRWIRRVCALLEVRLEAWVLTSSEADTLARREGFAALKLPSKAMLRDAGIEPNRQLSVSRAWVLNAIAGLSPDLLLVDTFPSGSFGELIAVLELARRRVLVQREVRPGFQAEEGYQALLPLYHRHIVPHVGGVGPILLRAPEELLPRQEARKILGLPDDRPALYLTLGGGGDLAAPQLLPRLVESLRASHHVVVGAGPLYQGTEVRGPGITWLSRYTPSELLTGVDVAVAAGGYNSFHELMVAGVPTVFLPQPRIADDQLARVQTAVEAGAGKLAGSWRELPELLAGEVGSPEACRGLVPTGGGLAAALAALEGLIPEADLELAGRVLQGPVLRVLSRSGNQGLELLRLFAGGPPRVQASRRALVLELRDQGQDVELPEQGDADGRVEAFAALCEELSLDLETALGLASGLAKKFPAASGSELLAACQLLFRAWAPFEDWMGAVSMLRAVPAQRSGYSLAGFSTDLSAWLGTQDDLFDALREFARLEDHGRRTVAAVLRELRA
jgi:UDP-N-acetylglucosamine--N-acetylmuramyl-(pentapeptide) pyrophosphoryl-undecaprenol N-acetylglucosamine transferase